MTGLFWVFALLAAGLLFLLMEIFIPSHGLLGVSGLAALGGSIYLAFNHHGVGLGLLIVLLVLVCLPIEIIVGVKLFPKTPIGKLMMLPARMKTRPEDRVEGADLAGYVGKAGVTVTQCRPAGIAEFDGKRMDVVAEGTIVDANRPVTVLRVDGNRVVIREK